MMRHLIIIVALCSIPATGQAQYRNEYSPEAEALRRSYEEGRRSADKTEQMMRQQDLDRRVRELEERQTRRFEELEERQQQLENDLLRSRSFDPYRR
jgi:hypothetical protein